ncbi:hypothetical protein L5515_013209 [Caenorhabditis briggsae]|uniref:RING-type domain-containing protein n=1 Tax=Caenorhabditis briggsae TaxID=6238 RepID=A0AAE9J5S8_CAEBR|nr:hypothetical protein L5515_013209 [Caenorhabditis briggsae]
MLEENQEKSLEIGELQQKNFRLSVKNETDDVQMKQLTDKLAKSELSVDYGTVGTSKISPQKIRCLICEKSIESGKIKLSDAIVYLESGKFHSKCAITLLKEHKDCPACNGDIPKF